MKNEKWTVWINSPPTQEDKGWDTYPSEQEAWIEWVLKLQRKERPRQLLERVAAYIEKGFDFQTLDESELFNETYFNQAIEASRKTLATISTKVHFAPLEPTCDFSKECESLSIGKIEGIETCRYHASNILNSPPKDWGAFPEPKTEEFKTSGQAWHEFDKRKTEKNLIQNLTEGRYRK